MVISWDSFSFRSDSHSEVNRRAFFSDKSDLGPLRRTARGQKPNPHELEGVSFRHSKVQMKLSRTTLELHAILWNPSRAALESISGGLVGDAFEFFSLHKGIHTESKINWRSKMDGIVFPRNAICIPPANYSQAWMVLHEYLLHTKKLKREGCETADKVSSLINSISQDRKHNHKPKPHARMSDSNHHHHHSQRRLVKLLSPLACGRQLKKMKGSLFHHKSHSPASPRRSPRRLPPLHPRDNNYDCINSTHFQAAPSSPSKMHLKIRFPKLHKDDYDRLSSAHMTPLPKSNDYDRLSSNHFAPLPKNSL